jgi:hypothetical protein
MEFAERRHRTNLERANALAKLVEERLPMDFKVKGDADLWPMVGAALLSRATTTLRHVFGAGPQGQSIDAATLARSLYEHVVHLAWLAAEPSAARMEAWRKVDLIARRKADTDARAVGEQFLDDHARASIQAQLARMTGPDRLTLTDLAVEADKHWAGKLPGMASHTERDSFRGFYAVLYRSYSATAHPTFMGLNHVVEDLPIGYRVVIEKPPEGRGPFGMTTILYAYGLHVAAASLGWPDARRINNAFDRYPVTP